VTPSGEVRRSSLRSWMTSIEDFGQTVRLSSVYLCRGQNPRDVVQLRGYDVPPHPAAPLLTFDESGFGENPCVMRDSGLTLFEWSLESATTYFRFSGDEREHS
jgi:hypothetical protein